MSVMKALLFASLLYLVAGDGMVPPGPPNPSSSTPATSTATSSPSPITNATTAAPTTPKPTTPSTTVPTSTSKPTTPSTSKPPTTSTSKPTTSSTSKPTTSSTSKPTPPTTSAPTTPKPSAIGTWVVNYTNSNKSCLVLDAQLDIDVHYKEGNTTKTLTVNVPSTAKSKGVCGTDLQNLTLTFDTLNVINFNFKRSNDSKSYDLKSVVINLANSPPGMNGSWTLAHTEDAFVTPIKSSYKCIKEQSLDLTPQTTVKNYEGVLRVSHFQVQAFRNATDTKFDEALDCASSETPDAVPIAVGCALAALVIIVLIAYLVGRRRSQARGYLSM